MNRPQILLDKKQSREFARAVYAEMGAYIQQHKVEYERFLKTEYPKIKKGS